MDCPDNLVYASDEQPGLCRKKWGRGYTYLDESGNKIKLESAIERIKALAIPPAWRNVWICALPNGHLQATGMDDKNRKQYLYHPDWIAYRQSAKFDKLYSFGEHLPAIRSTVSRDLRRHHWPREKVAALVVHLMDNYYFRVGQSIYARKNKSYGVATLRKKHLEIHTDSLVLRYRGKSGKDQRVRITSAPIVRKIRRLSELPGYEIFRYETDNQCRTIDATDINRYLKEITATSVTAKDFRTWGGSKLAIAGYEEVIGELAEKPQRKFETTLVRKVARALGNTVSVCKEYYIHPKVLETLSQHYMRQEKSLGLTDSNDSDEVEEYLMAVLRPDN